MRLPKETFEEAVNQIIDSAKYMHLKERESIFKKFWEKLGKLLEKIFTKGDTHSSINTNTTQNTFIIIVILLIGVLIFYLVRQNKYIAENKKVIYGETIDEETTYESLYKKAIQCEQEKNYKDATRLHFISILVSMNEKSLCFLDDSKTNREIIKVLKDKEFSGVYLFKNIGDYFQYIWYGNKEIEKEKFIWYKDQINNLFMEVKNYHEKA
ncbi:hypothetical protein [Crassaminicella profunda]|uniref:hypothetical protein n=1 Tax=Crassaminicella profunda TaxID=1286698 RepID=UPI001CA6D2F7|nr:hypothetical protein [Crassaminicella profunda]QZY56414.1 hypothetical protein K7H06_05675 [Crassaminicella profunda]